MTEREARSSPEEEIKPISIELTTRREQEVMLEIANFALRTGTLEELEGNSTGVREENIMWRPIFRKLANNLGRKYDPSELLIRGIVDDIPLQTLAQWTKGNGIQSPMEKEAIKRYARYFLKQKRQALEKHKPNK